MERLQPKPAASKCNRAAGGVGPGLLVPAAGRRGSARVAPGLHPTAASALTLGDTVL